jgi:hypothetical protein
VAAQRAHGAEVAAVESEDRVRVVVGREGDVHRVGEIEVERTVPGPHGLGGREVDLGDLGHDDPAYTHPAADVVDRADRGFPSQFTGGDMVDLGEQQRRHDKEAGGHERLVGTPVLRVRGVERGQ